MYYTPYDTFYLLRTYTRAVHFIVRLFRGKVVDRTSCIVHSSVLVAAVCLCACEKQMLGL